MAADNSPSRSPLYAHRWFLFSAAFLAGLAGLILLLPIAAKYLVIDWLEEHGAEEASIERVWFNPFRARLVVEGVTVKSDGRTTLNDSRMVINLSPWSLIHRTVTLQQVTYRDLLIELQRYEDGGWRIASYHTGPTAAGEPAAEPWTILAGHALLTNCTIELQTPELALTLVIDRAEVNGLSTAPGAPPGSLSLAGSLNGSPLEIDLQQLTLAPSLSGEGELKVQGFQLEALAGLAGQGLGTLAGALSLDGSASFNLDEQQTLSAEYDGSLTSRQLNLAADAFSLDAGEINWQGKMKYSRPKDQAGQADAQGKLALADIRADDGAAKVRLTGKSARLEGTLKANLGEPLALDYDGGLELGPIDASAEGYNLAEEQLKWDGTISYQARQGGPDIKADGTLALQGDLQVTAPERDDGFAAATTFDWQGKVNYSRQNGKAGQASAQGTLALGEIRADHIAAKVRLTGKTARLEGTLTADLGEPLAFGYDGALELGPIDASTEGYSIGEEQLLWDGTIAYQDRRDGPDIEAEGTLELQGGLVETGPEHDNGFTAATDLSWDGSLSLGQKAQGRAAAAKGSLALRDSKVTLAEKHLRITAPDNEADLDYRLVLAEQPEVEGSGSLHLGETKIFDSATKETIASLASLEVTELKGEEEGGLSIAGVEAKNLFAAQPETIPLRLELAGLDASDMRTTDFTTLEIGRLELDGLSAAATENDAQVGRLAAAVVNDLAFGASCQASFSSARMENIVLLEATKAEGESAPLEVGETTLTSLCYDSNRPPRLDTLTLAGLIARIRKNSNGNFDIADRLAAMGLLATADGRPAQGTSEATGANGNAGGKSEGNAKSEAQTMAAPLFLGKLSVGEKSRVHYEDHTLPEPFVADLDLKSLEIIGPQAATANQELQLSLQGELAGRAPLSVDGTIRPYGDSTGLDLELQLKNYPLKNLSSYAVEEFGKALASGQLQLDSTINLEGLQLDVDNTLLLKQLETKDVSQELADKYKNQLPISLDAALSLLRDGEGNIELDIPISGTVGEMDIDITDLIVTAMSKAIVPATTGYLTYALGPYAALAYVGYKVGENLLQIDLPPVQYEHLQETVPVGSEKYLERVATVLEDKDDRDLQLCPRVSIGELREKGGGDDKAKAAPLDEESRARLEELGQRRARNLQAHLISEHGIAEERLLICDTTVVEDEDAPSEVRLQL